MLKSLNLITVKWGLVCFLSTVLYSTLRAQEPLTANDTLKTRLAAAALGYHAASLFVHYDKTTYIPNEAVWFTAYLLSIDTLTSRPDILSVVLVKNTGHTIALQKKFIIAGTVSSGSFLVPDSIAAGDYSIIAYANHFVKGVPDILFTQRIDIRRVEQSDLKPTAKRPAEPAFTLSDSARISIKFYPEGGDLVENLPSYVGWEAKDGTGASLKLQATLLENGELVDTIETSASGTGKFFISPKPGRKYAVKITGSGSQPRFEVPAPRKTGVSIAISSAMAGDTLVFKVASTLPGRVNVVLHNARQAFYALPGIDMEESRIFRIPLDSVPRGLAAITVFDEKMRPCSERIFFAHYDQAAAATVKTDVRQYGKRQKVTLKLDLNSNTAKEALVSVACVQTNLIDRRHFNDIENYGFLDQELSSLPALFNGNMEKKKNYLEDVLLVKGWRRYRQDTLAGDIPPAPIPEFTGDIKVNGKQAKRPVTLTLIGNSNVFFINTDKHGHFIIPDDELVASDDKVFALFATGDDAFTTRISLRDPFEQINRSLAFKLPVYAAEAPSGERFTNPALLLARDQIQLNTVKIIGRPIDERFNAIPTPGMHKNACGDYVCLLGALNCPYPGHTYKTSIPIKGHRYIRHEGERHDDSSFTILANVPFIYEGCDTKNHSLIRFGGLNLAKEYYAYSETEASNSEPLLNSTLYWGSQVKLTRGNQKKISFYTGDVSGKFSVIMQGITPGGVVYSEEKFEVTK